MLKKTVKVVLLLGCVMSFALAQESNILNNGGFEEGKFGWLWSLNDNDGAMAEWSIDSTSGEAYEGTKFYRITVTEVSSENWHIQLKDPTWPAVLGKVYQFSFYGKADAAHSASISVYGGPSGKDQWRTTTSIEFTTEWKKYTQLFTADAEGPGVHNFAIVVGDTTGVYDIDGCTITESDPGDNLYTNGGFEADGSGWNFWRQEDDDGNYLTPGSIEFVEDATAPEGTKVCKITIEAVSLDENDEVVAWHAQLQDGPWTADSGWSYTYTFQAKADSAFPVQISAGAGPTRDYEYLGGTDYTITNEWMDYSYTYTSIISGPDSVNFNLYVGGQTGTIYLDSITLVGVEPEDPNAVYKNIVATGMRTQSYVINVLPDHLCFTASEKLESSSVVSIYSIAGRLFSAKPVFTAGRSFNLPKPPSGTWVVRVNNSNASNIIIP